MAQVILTDGMNRGDFRSAINDNFTENYTSLAAITTVSVTGAISLDATAYGKLHRCSGTSADYTVDLPTAVGHGGETIAFKGLPALTKVVTIDGLTTETIDGELTRKISATGVLVVCSNGTNWEIVHEVGSWIPWTPTWTGFSAAPTSVDATYFRQGKQVTIKINGTAGTSDATTMTITNLPFTARGASNWVVIIVNNGAAAAGRCTTADGSSTLTFFATAAGGAFTGSGSKLGAPVITYETQ